MDAFNGNGFVTEFAQGIVDAGGYEVSISNAKAGDIVIVMWPSNTDNRWDHAEIVISSNGSTVNSIGGNSGSNGTLYTRQVVEHAPLSGYKSIKVYRPNYKSVQSKPSNCSISVNKSTITLGETVRFTYSISGATTKGIGIDRVFSDGSFTRENSFSVPADSGTIDYTFTQAGTYCCIVEGSNSAGYNCSSGVYVQVNEPSPTLTIYYDCYGSSPTIDTSKGYYLSDYNRICTTTYAHQTAWDTANVYYETLKSGETLGTNGLHDFATFGLTAPTGYVFAGWRSGDNGQLLNETTRYTAADLTDEISDGDCDVWLTAKFTVAQYTVTFDANGGSCGYISRTYTYGYAYQFLPAATCENYTFAGWYTAASGGTQVTEDSIVETAADHTLYAHWTPYVYAVKFNGNGATGGSMRIQYFNYDEAQNLFANEFVRAYTVTYDANYATGGTSTVSATATASFNGWATSADGEKVYDDGQYLKNFFPARVFSLYANWTLGSVTLLPSPVRAGYTFGGWYADAALTVYAGAAGESYTPISDTTLYAKWAANDYTVTYDVNHHSVQPNLFLSGTAKKTEHGVTYSYNASTGEFSLRGTATDNADSLASVPFSVEAGTYTVTVHRTGGILTENQGCAVIELYAGNERLHTHFGNDLDYRRQVDARNEDVVKTWTITDEIAQAVDNLRIWVWYNNGWASPDGITYQVKIEKNSTATEMSPAAARVTYDTNYVLPPDPIRTDGYAFLGWFTENGEEVTAESVFTRTEDQILYAHWKALPMIAVPDTSTAVIDGEHGFIYGLQLAPTERILNESYLTTQGGATLTYKTSGYIGTGTKVDVLDETGNVVQSYTIVIFGDTDGDGTVTQSDIAVLKAHMNGADELPPDDARLLAGDVDGDGFISLMDITLMKGIMNGSVTLNQATRKSD